MQIANDIRPFESYRHWLSEKAYGGAFLILRIHSSLDDLRGAIAGQQIEYGIDLVLQIVTDCAAIRRAGATGLLPQVGLDWRLSADMPDHFDETSHDLCRRAVSVCNGQGLSDLAGPLSDLVQRTEDALEFPSRLPVARTSEGYFPTLRLARQWSVLLAELGLPDIVNPAWLE